MKKCLSVIVVVLFLGVSVIPSVVGDNPSFVNTIYVDDDAEPPYDGTQEHPYQFIQDAIDNASDGDTVFVFNGTYYEEVLINTSITLQGEDANSTIIEGEITIFSGHTNVCYFSLRNRRMYGKAIILRGHRGAVFCTISNNIISNSSVGIHCGEFCNNIMIKNNNIFNNSCGVTLWMSNSTTVSNNNIFNNKQGITLDLYSMNNLIKRNNIISNEMGICCGSLFNKITSNNLINNSVNAYICTRIFICRMIPIPIIGHPNLWYKNYWSDWDGKGPMVIKGEFLLGFYAIEFVITIPINSYDWFPAKEPYEIQVPEV